MRPYELVVLLHPDLEIDADAPISKLEKLVETAGGKVTKRDNWGKRRLAYQVKKQDFAVYAYFELLLDPSKVPGFERNLILAEEVLRHLIVIKEEEKVSKAAAKAAKPKAAVVSEEGTDGKEL
jgi:small subunit ribosomal protein S6